MSRVRCLYCGRTIADDQARCPHCDAPSHYQQRGFRFGARQRFVMFFVVLAVVVLGLALWLPR